MKDTNFYQLKNPKLMSFITWLDYLVANPKQIEEQNERFMEQLEMSACLGNFHKDIQINKYIVNKMYDVVKLYKTKGLNSLDG